MKIEFLLFHNIIANVSLIIKPIMAFYRRSNIFKENNLYENCFVNYEVDFQFKFNTTNGSEA